MKYPAPMRSMLMAGVALFGTVSVVWSDAVDIVATSAVEDVTEALFGYLQEKQPKWAVGDLKPVTIEYGSPTVKLEMVPVPGGTLKGPEGREITIAPFWIGKYEVRYNEFVQFFDQYELGGLGRDIGKLRTKKRIPYDGYSQPSALSYVQDKMGDITDRTPMVLVSQHNAIKYTKWLSAVRGEYFRLPTEAEWLFAARAGAPTALPNAVDDFAVHYDNSNGFSPSEVGSKKANALGIYDMIGNAAEWVLDGWSDKPFGEGDATWVVPQKAFPTVAVGSSWYDDRPEGATWPREASEPKWQDTDPQIPKSKFYLSDAPFVGFRIVRPMTLPELEAVKEMWRSGWEREQISDD